MIPELQTLFHAGYVAFVFGCLLFGALAFRQILDNIAVRRLRLGEDRASFLSAPSMTLVTVMLAVTTCIGWAVAHWAEPQIYTYALPLILLVQSAQMLLRVVFQRTVAKTRGLIVRSVLREQVRVAPYADIIGITFDYGRVWVRVTLDVLPDDRITFRIFKVSASSLSRILLGSCFCPIRSIGRVPVTDHTSIPTSA